MKDKTLTSERLTLRALREDDAAFIFALMTSETWIENIGERGFTSVDDARRFLKENALRFFREKGWGTFIILRTSDGKAIGTVGLYEREELEHVDFGYALLPEFAGQGYATEASRTYLNEVRAMNRFTELLAVVKDTNRASIRVLEKLGFASSKAITLYEKKMQLFRKSFKAKD